MAWLVALISLASFVWLLVKFPRFRIAVVLFLAALAAIVFFWIKSESEREANSHSLISVSQLEIQGISLRNSHGSWEVAGTVRNNSTHTLTAMKLKVTVRDCVDESNCVVIGEDSVDIWSVTVPPSQLRAFNGSVFLSNMPTPKKLVGNYQLVQTTAKLE